MEALGKAYVDGFSLWTQQNCGTDAFLPEGPDGHLNSTGYRLIADAVAARLVATPEFARKFDDYPRGSAVICASVGRLEDTMDAPARTRSKTRESTLRLALLLVALIVALVIAEVATRIIHPIWDGRDNIDAQ